MIVLPEIVQVVSQLLKDEENCYLVGGAVRDIVLERDIQDFDFSTDSDPRKLARKVADRLGGVFYVMDEKRFTSRVILQQKSGSPLVMDFSVLQGTLENDLQLRDFTINAMAVEVRTHERIFDPLKGGRDLQERWLRLCNPLSLVDDPVRVIRAVRYATELRLKIESQTKQSINEGVNNLNQVSFERKRDELFKILENPNSFSAILLLQKLGILDHLGCDPTFDRMDQLRTYELLQEMILPSGKKSGLDYFIAAAFLSAMFSVKKKLSLLMTERNSDGHTRFQLDKFTLLTSRESVAEKTSLHFLDVFSNDELNFIQLFHRKESEVNLLLTKVGEIDDRDVYRFFRHVGDSGINLVLLALAKVASKPAVDLNQDEWLKILILSTRLFGTWFEHPEISQPRPLVNGDEIMMELKLNPSPMIGQLLESLKEEQAAGEIASREEALKWLISKYNQIKTI